MVTAWYILMNYYYDVGYEYKNLIHRFLHRVDILVCTVEKHENPLKRIIKMLLLYTQIFFRKTNSKSTFDKVGNIL